MARLSSEVRFALTTCDDPGEALTAVNESILENEVTHHFATMVLMVLDPASGEVALAIAGHPPPLLGAAEASRSRSARTWRVAPSHRARAPDHYRTARFGSSPATRCSRSATDCSRCSTPPGRCGDEEGVSAVLTAHHGDCETLHAALLAARDQHAETENASDDTTLVSVTRLP